MKKHLLLAIGLSLSGLFGAGAQTNFTQITDDPLVADPGIHTRGAWGDFNNDGFLDVFVCTYDGNNFFHTNNGNGTFTSLTQVLPVLDSNSHTGAAAADYDNDGWLDLVALTGGASPMAGPIQLYHNNGEGNFSLGGGDAVTNRTGFYDSCAWADYDNDGFVDLFVTDNGDSNSSGGKNLLFHNDGFMDLLVLNISSSYPHNFLYHNNRDGTFTRVTTNLIATDSWPDGCQCGAWADYDNDGLLDLYVTDNGGRASRLYHNNGNGSFSSIATAPHLPVGLSCGAAWGDYDNDGYLDLFVSGQGTNGLFHNNGDGTFAQVLTGPIATGGLPGHTHYGCSWVDYDNDGFLDLFVEKADAGGGTLLFHNIGNANAWLEVKLVGTVANRSAIGAKVRVNATIGGKTFQQTREISNGGGWNLSPLIAHFGLGDATNVTTLRIEWPSGSIQEFQNVAPRQNLTITEPPRLTAILTNGVPQFSLKAWPGMQFAIQASTDLAQWTTVGTEIVTDPAGLATIVDTNASGTTTRFFRALSQ